MCDRLICGIFTLPPNKIGNAFIKPTSVRNLGVHCDSLLNMHKRITEIDTSANYPIRCIGVSRECLSTNGTVSGACINFF